MAALGAGAGAFEGDTTRAKLALEAQRLRQQDRQHGEMMALRGQELAARREDAEHARQRADRQDAWSDLLRQQEMEERNLRMQGLRNQMEKYQTLRDEEIRQMENRRQMVQSALGVAALSAIRGGGILTDSQVAQFNKDNGTNYTAIGNVNPITRQPYEDGGLHFVELDPNGAFKSDNRLSDDFLKAITQSEFGREMLLGPSERERITKMQSKERADARREQLRSQFIGNAVQNISRLLRDNGVTEDKIGEMMESQLLPLLDQYDKAMGLDGGRAQAPAPQGDGTIVGGGGSASGSGGMGGASNAKADTTTVLEKMKAERERRKREGQKSAAPSQPAVATRGETATAPQNGGGSAVEAQGQPAVGPQESYEKWLTAELKAGRKPTYESYLNWLNLKRDKRENQQQDKGE